MRIEQTLRVTAIRSQNPKGFGGCIFSGKAIGESGQVTDASAYYVVKASARATGGVKVQPGQWWKVSGTAYERIADVNGYRVTEWQLEATSGDLMRPSGKHIIAFIADCPAFVGIGYVKASKLWDTFGDGLYEILDRRDTAALAPVLSSETANVMIAAWAEYGDLKTLQWFASHGLNLGIGSKVLAFYGDEAIRKLEADPYRLLSFCATWGQVDKLARNFFSIKHDDPRRLHGAVEEALYRTFAEGHTRITASVLFARLANILDGHCRNIASKAFASGRTNGSCIVDVNGGVHPIGAWIMEATVARAIVSRVTGNDSLPVLSPGHVDAVIDVYESEEGIALNDEQRLAIHTSSAHSLSLIVGGAGVGKTTVLKGLYRVFDETRTRVFQMALAGLAAKRMQEASGRPASTIASFLRSAKEHDMSGDCVVVVDEASMVDIITMSRLCEILPSHVRIVLVGDIGQLMPVGPGLVLHALVRLPDIPQVELKLVKRYSGAIARAAQSVRDGIWPELSDDATAPIAFLPCAVGAIADLVVDLYARDAENTQILSARKSGVDGTLAINTLCQIKFTRHNRPLLVYLDEFDSMAGTGFYIGDQLLCTKNLWEWNLQNGSVGRLVEIEDTPQLLTSAEGAEIGHVIGWAVWDGGERRPILKSMLDNIELGNAVTVHKSQGSQWERVIVVLTGSRMMDRTLIYTAMTRAQNQVILVGDPVVARRAVEGLPRVDSRLVGLVELIEEYTVRARGSL